MDLYRVKPLFGELKDLYCPAWNPKKGKDPYSYYPATIFLLWIKNLGYPSELENINPNGMWMNAIKNDLYYLNPGKDSNGKDRGLDAFDYLQSQPNGCWFNNGLNICVYPNDKLMIDLIKYRPATNYHGLGGYWGKVETTIQYSNTSTPPSFSTLKDYDFSYQCDENSLGQILMSIDDKGLLMRFPRMSKHDLYINMDCVELVDQPPQPAITKTVNVFSDGSIGV